MTYAADTSVSVERSRDEIERTLVRFGADAFSYGWESGRAAVTFRAQGRIIRLTVVVPGVEEFRHTKAGASRSASAQKTAQAKSERQRWRALALIVKAKLTAVESGVETFEEAFLAHVLLPDGTTVGEWMEPQVAEVYETGRMPSLLPGVKALPSGD